MTDREWNFNSGDTEKDIAELNAYFEANPEIAGTIRQDPRLIDLALATMLRLYRSPDPEISALGRAEIERMGLGIVLLGESEWLTDDDPRREHP